MTLDRDYAYAWKNGWRWALSSLRVGNFRAFVGAIWYTLVLGHIGEACQECGRPYVLWYADDELYGAVTKLKPYTGKLRPGLFCPDCFDRKADHRGIVLRWVPVPIRIGQVRSLEAVVREMCDQVDERTHGTKGAG